eukprot:6664713-Prymnesium_polylepis.1
MPVPSPEPEPQELPSIAERWLKHHMHPGYTIAQFEKDRADQSLAPQVCRQAQTAGTPLASRRLLAGGRLGENAQRRQGLQPSGLHLR